jgi:hypothetical protein
MPDAGASLSAELFRRGWALLPLLLPLLPVGPPRLEDSDNDLAWAGWRRGGRRMVLLLPSRSTVKEEPAAADEEEEREPVDEKEWDG